mmetsp:Transcript_36012/g.56205  ORF Transcript_36012/g.56205 Transcript_36012/m.56205 type:complete len:92 (-) Transcript_36012:1097-1372(-)
MRGRWLLHSQRPSAIAIDSCCVGLLSSNVDLVQVVLPSGNQPAQISILPTGMSDSSINGQSVTSMLNCELYDKRTGTCHLLSSFAGLICDS